jgi:tRNA 2-selenouridine synthase
MSVEDRAALLLREYRHFTENRDELFARLDRLVEMHGRRTVAGWRELAEAGRWSEFVTALLDAHYDPAYDRSLARNYVAAESGSPLPIDGHDDDSLRAAARALLDAVEPPPS